ncbi:hypothetical protein BDY21DRAFT_362269 [Lineolata rhizophorae]|uniref:Uncharacterized protein n=1 Tax=Lineolata rhizophorae TaxID=578093 RepID=A0A6A6P6W9_9PEZI|nr:hypothetical protein BDY21DRAFT_362269 [Lineolata rhizophorae]
MEETRAKTLSKRKIRQRRQKRTSGLNSVLARTGIYHHEPGHTRRHDYSYFSPISMPEQKQYTPPEVETPQVSLHSITAKFITRRMEIKRVRPEMLTGQQAKESVEGLFSTEEQEYLMGRGYNWDDVALWSDLLCCENSDEIIRILEVPDDSIELKLHQQLPVFVILATLRRKVLSPVAARFLLEYVLLRLRHEVHRIQTGALADKRPWATSDTLMLLFIRMVRMVRKTAPLLIPMATSILLTRLPKSGSGVGLPKKSFMLNRALSQVALPAPIDPVASATYQELAQLDILRFMSEHDPPLVLTQEGYRAVSLVQLAQKKTRREADWALLKSGSWPPWKKDRSGIDASKGPEYGISQAGQTLRQSQQAGYAASGWEETASIFTGWDTDGTPTIQMRGMPTDILPSLSAKACLESLTKGPTMGDQFRLWAARVRATRTVEEAWAYFLAGEEALPLPNEKAYQVMISKLNAKLVVPDQPLPVTPEDELRVLLPGDSKEVWPAPSSPLESIYLREPVPSTKQLYQRMREKGLEMKGRTLAMLTRYSETLEDGVCYLREHMDEESLRALLAPVDPTSVPRTEVDREPKLPRNILTAFVILLCRSKREEYNHLPDISTDLKHPVLHAWRLVSAQQSTYKPAWYAILDAICQEDYESTTSTDGPSNRDYFFHRTPLDPVQNWRKKRTDYVQAHNRFCVAEMICADMKARGVYLDQEGFRIMCHIACKETIALRRELKRVRDYGLEPTESLVEYAETVLLQSPKKLQQLFYKSFGPPKNKGEHGLTSWMLDEASLEKVSQEPASLSDEMDGPSRSWSENIDLEDTDPLEPMPDGFGLYVPLAAPDLPRLRCPPDMITIHWYLRTLGVMRSWGFIIALGRWLTSFRKELNIYHDFERNYAARHRRLIAVPFRVFLERSWQHSKAEVETAPWIAKEKDEAVEPKPLGERQATEMGKEQGPASGPEETVGWRPPGESTEQTDKGERESQAGPSPSNDERGMTGWQAPPIRKVYHAHDGQDDYDREELLPQSRKPLGWRRERALVALDQKLWFQEVLADMDHRARPRRIAEARRIFERNRQWGPWPSDDEVEAYLVDPRNGNWEAYV